MATLQRAVIFSVEITKEAQLRYPHASVKNKSTRRNLGILENSSFSSREHLKVLWNPTTEYFPEKDTLLIFLEANP